MNLHDQDTFLRGKNEGLQHGRTEGIQLGISRGIQQGRTEGSQQKAIETAKALLKFGDTVEKVSIATGLPRETIVELGKDS